MQTTYIIITPVRNEEKYIEDAIKSIISQTLRPVEWLIVNDGSTDETGGIIDRYAEEFHWIKKIDIDDIGPRKTGGKVVQVFNEGYNRIAPNDWEFIVKLDGDLTFGPDYFKKLIGKFLVNHRLGIASGVYFQQDEGDLWEKVKMPAYHAAGACKVVRRSCYEDIGGFVAAAGWDTVDEIRAMAQGWETRHFDDLPMKHHKPEGSGIGVLRTSKMHGEIYYISGGDKLFFLLKILHRVKTRPFLINASALFWGYANAAMQKKPLLVNDVEARYYRKILRERLRFSIRQLKPI